LTPEIFSASLVAAGGRIQFADVTVEQARQQLLILLDESGGYLTASTIEADRRLAENREVVSAAARMLATEPEIKTGEETDVQDWFPYSFLSR
jgi:hypothetical protein